MPISLPPPNDRLLSQLADEGCHPDQAGAQQREAARFRHTRYVRGDSLEQNVSTVCFRLHTNVLIVRGAGRQRESGGCVEVSALDFRSKLSEGVGTEDRIALILLRAGDLHLY